MKPVNLTHCCWRIQLMMPLSQSEVMASITTELKLIKGAESVEVDSATMTFSFYTKKGKIMYSPAIRKLYYTLLTDQIPPAKIESTIKAVIKCFLHLNIEKLSLPEEKCSGYMRREELKTISMAHKATLVNNLVSKEMIHINTDGTTKLQKIGCQCCKWDSTISK